MTNNSETGQVGEDLACSYLKKQGYRVIERNFRKKWGELDIIAKDRDNTLVFIEVKAMRQIGNAANDILPEDNLTAFKLKKLQRTGQLFAGKHSELIDDQKGWRIDLVAITIFEDGSHRINYYENI